MGEPSGGYDLVGEARNAACRDHLVLYLATAEGRVTAAGFRASGCPAALGIGSAAAELLPGLGFDDGLGAALRLRFTDAYGEPSALHRHALQLVLESLAGLRPAGT